MTSIKYFFFSCNISSINKLTSTKDISATWTKQVVYHKTKTILCNVVLFLEVIHEHFKKWMLHVHQGCHIHLYRKKVILLVYLAFYKLGYVWCEIQTVHDHVPAHFL